MYRPEAQPRKPPKSLFFSLMPILESVDRLTARRQLRGHSRGSRTPSRRYAFPRRLHSDSRLILDDLAHPGIVWTRSGYSEKVLAITMHALTKFGKENAQPLCRIY